MINVNIKNKFKKLSVIVVFCVIAASSLIKTYSHLPLKGLFKVLKRGDIGFGHALLHSGWIENMYQYGAGKPHREIEVRNRKKWKIEDKGDAVANLVRKFWFRRSEDHQLLPTQFGCLANILNDQLGKVFGQLINCVYQGLSQESQDRLIEVISLCGPQGDQYRQELTVFWRELIDQEYALKYDRKFDGLRYANIQLQDEISKLEEEYKIAELNRQIAQASKACKQSKGLSFKEEKKKIESKFDRKGYIKALKEAKQRIFVGIEKEIQDGYRAIELSVKKLQATIDKKVKQKRDEIQKELLIPIAKSLKFCASGKVYPPRTTEGILWALFFHKLDGLISFEAKIKAINDCLSVIKDEFKNQEFCGCVELQDLYNQEDFGKFEKDIKDLDAEGQVHMMRADYYLSLHYFINRVAGKFPPAIAQGSYGYEYEEGKISYARPDCHETAMLDMLSVLWFNPTKNVFDDSLFPERVLQNGQGLKRLREALKYIYFADKKKIKSDEYTCECLVGKKDGTTELVGFTSLAKLKKLGKITPQEVELLDISEVPVSYITRAEVKQEFMNIVSGIPGVLYCSKSRDEEKDFELETDVRNVVKIFKYFYGTNIKDIIGLEYKAKGITTGSRTINFELENKKNNSNTIDIIVRDDGNRAYFSMKMNIKPGHTSFSVSGREKAIPEFLHPNFILKIFQKTITAHQKSVSCLKILSIFTFLTTKSLFSKKLLSKISSDLLILNLTYYSLVMIKHETKLAVIRDILIKQVEHYDTFKPMVYNLIDMIPQNDRSLQRDLLEIMIESKIYKKDSFLKKYIKKMIIDSSMFYGKEAWVPGLYELLRRVLKHGYIDLALNIVNNPRFDTSFVFMGRVVALALQLAQKKLLKEKEYTDFVFKILQDSKFDAWGEGLRELLLLDDKGLALKLIKHPKFKIDYSDMEAVFLWGVIPKYNDIAIEMVKSEAFYVNLDWVQKILKVATEYLEETLEVQRLIDVIKYKLSEKQLK